MKSHLNLYDLTSSNENLKIMAQEFCNNENNWQQTTLAIKLQLNGTWIAEIITN